MSLALPTRYNPKSNISILQSADPPATAGLLKLRAYQYASFSTLQRRFLIMAECKRAKEKGAVRGAAGAAKTVCSKPARCATGMANAQFAMANAFSLSNPKFGSVPNLGNNILD
jgi:hypothetical protein